MIILVKKLGKWTCHYHGLPFWQYISHFSGHIKTGDVTYDQPNNSSLSHKIESVQYNVVIGITRAVRRTSKKKLYQELGLESLRNRRWLRRMSYLYKIISTKSPPFLYELMPSLQKSHRYPGGFKTLRWRTEFFRDSFLPFFVNEWNKLDSDIKNCLLRDFPQKGFGFYKTRRKQHIRYLWPIACYID